MSDDIETMLNNNPMFINYLDTKDGRECVRLAALSLKETIDADILSELSHPRYKND